LYNGYWNTVEPIKECVGLLVAIARERSEAFIYVTRYVHMILIVHRNLEGNSGLNENHTFLVGRDSVARERRGSLLPVRDTHGTGPS